MDFPSLDVWTSDIIYDALVWLLITSAPILALGAVIILVPVVFRALSSVLRGASGESEFMTGKNSGSALAENDHGFQIGYQEYWEQVNIDEFDEEEIDRYLAEN